MVMHIMAVVGCTNKLLTKNGNGHEILARVGCTTKLVNKDGKGLGDILGSVLGNSLGNQWKWQQ